MQTADIPVCLWMGGLEDSLDRCPACAGGGCEGGWAACVCGGCEGGGAPALDAALVLRGLSTALTGDGGVDSGLENSRGCCPGCTENGREPTLDAALVLRGLSTALAGGLFIVGLMLAIGTG